ncbi:ImmA/IrrE family metallo-endopeptidase [Luteibacter sahnii]|uniref:ImmA/IrrE family metallo-endopeptidase n=1 Tax=Luteibacter sahnii TaxID=3021977 RepID=UPI002A69CBE3|nr:ImmA/IrrE family metallo-endopeptidase [Luteibacter sp. PPL193]MDY1548544.1 ImmA/IrrE family metallo-endopeptidase [Luteibacter sp. PPL193]
MVASRQHLAAPRVIRTEEQNEAYLAEIMQLIAKGSSLDAEENERLELLSVLVEAYEATRFTFEPPDAIDAIQFRMQERGLKKADLIPYFGTSSRVSEVLGRKRPLTLPMIRELSRGLGISAETLLGLAEPTTKPSPDDLDWSLFPAKEMSRRGWLQSLGDKASGAMEQAVRSFITDAGLQFGAAAFRRTIAGEAQSPATRYSLYAWLAQVVQRARVLKKQTKIAHYDHSVMSAAFLKELAQLSWSEQGPSLAVEFLNSHGIAVVIEEHLKGTQLDGAALRDLDGTPIVALTLRYDRIDNFWFTLLHEVAHLWKHVGDHEAFLDDLDASSEDRREAEANRLAREAFIPRLIWKRSPAYLSPSRETVLKLSHELRIHPAIIAGRLRRETGNYKILGDLLGQGAVRRVLSHQA